MYKFGFNKSMNIIIVSKIEINQNSNIKNYNH